MRFEICLAGHGGQGLVLAGKILGEAIALHSRKNVVQTQSYGPESRGGASRSEVVISDETINYPKVTRLDLLLALSQESVKKYLLNLKDDGILIVDPFGVKETPSGKYKIYSLPIMQTAKNELGKMIFGNIVALGAIAALTRIIPLEHLEQAVLNNVPQKFQADNKRALQIGFKLGETVQKGNG
ncbi:2-oxoacid:acceptor oxidoreductase family protein [Candidatus Saganbacteria bacterium]|nr:2-oxoacid:acceptor oxidoreductase family protein [Candidatus Saganbacteria bacterium]